MAGKSTIFRGRVMAVSAALLILGACAGVPLFNLADIPQAPTISSPQDNEAVIAELTTDRARTVDAAQDVRRQPFALPDPAPPFPPGF